MVNVVLVGMPASGKTTIATLLAEKLPDYTLIDTDNLIEKTQGISISEIFQNFSEDYFRKLEHDTIQLICSSGIKKIISIGGGAFDNPDNRAVLLKFGLVFYLKSDLDILYYRISNDKKRPLLQNENPRKVLETLLNKREQNYKKAHYTIDTDTMSKEDIVRFILNEANIKSSN